MNAKCALWMGVITLLMGCSSNRGSVPMMMEGPTPALPNFRQVLREENNTVNTPTREDGVMQASTEAR